jgi:hypothetical protein
MKEEEIHTIIYPFYHKNDRSQYYIVGKTKNFSGRQDLMRKIALITEYGEKKGQVLFFIKKEGEEIVIGTENIRKALFDFLMSSVDNDIRAIRRSIRYEVLELHINSIVEKEKNFRNYLAERLEEEFHGIYAAMIISNEEGQRTIYCFLTDYLDIPVMHLDM